MACNALFRSIKSGDTPVSTLTEAQLISLFSCINEQEKLFLQLLLLRANVAASSGGGGGASYTAASAAATVSSVTAAGTVPAGLWEYSVANVGAAPGTLGGVAFPVGAQVTMRGYTDEVTKEARTPGALAYDATGTTYLITQLA